jgi:hypothetical protein
VLDVRTDQSVIRAPLPGTRGFITMANDGVVLKAYDQGVDVIEVEDWTAHPVITEYEAAVTRGSGMLIVGDKLGVITEITVATGARREVGRLGVPIEPYAVVQGRWAVMYGGSMIWRGDGQLAESIDAGAPVISAGIDAEGTVYAAIGPDIVRWPLGAGRPAVLVRPPVPLHAVVSHVVGAVLALSNDNAMWRIDVATGVVGQIMPAVQTMPEIDLAGRCAVGIRDQNVVIADLVDRTWWTLGSGNLYRATPGPTCDAIYVLDDRRELQVWNTAMSRDPAELRRWLDARTNARASESHGVIEWVLP